MNRTLIVSPSGNLYGSEQVLIDYLANTKWVFDVAVPAGSMLQHALKGTQHRIIPFGGVRKFYLRVMRDLLKGTYRKVYLNEGAHIRYACLLSRIFPAVEFIVHIRIVEDTQDHVRACLARPNLRSVTISDYMQGFLGRDTQVVYDLYDFPEEMPYPKTNDRVRRLAIIGRITYSKGFRELVDFVKALENNGRGGRYQINLYGDIIDDVRQDPSLTYLRSLGFVHFRGFLPKSQIYGQNDVVLHFSKTEPLGRIFFESVSYGIPLVGFAAGGIGEIGNKTGLGDLLLAEGENEGDRIIAVLDHLDKDWNWVRQKLEKAFVRMRDLYGVRKYTDAMDEMLS